MTPSLSAEAEDELLGAARHYAAQGGPNLGATFIDEFERVLTLLCAQPELGTSWRNRRRFPLRRFPYSIVYYVIDDSLRVLAIAHHRRRPQYWQGRS